MGKYEKIAAAKATATAIQNMLDLGLTKEQILKKYTAEQFYSAVKK